MSQNKIHAFLRNNIHYLIFAVFALLQGGIMRYTIQYGDDYFYTTFLNGGPKSFVKRNVRHYLEVNGRCFVHLLDELLLSGGTITAFRIFNTLCVCAIVFLTAYLGADCLNGGLQKKEFKPALIASCFAFSIIDISMASTCIYWATGAVNYMFPMLPLLGMLILTERHLRFGTAGAGLLILSVLTGLTVEQYSFAADVVILFALIRLFLMKKRPGVLFCLTGILTWLASASVFFAPRNQVRKTFHADFYQIPLVKRLLSNLHGLSGLTVSRSGMAPALLLFFALCAFLYWQKKRRLPVLLNGIAGIGVSAYLLSENLIAGYFACAAAGIALLYDLWLFFSEFRAGASPLNALLLMLAGGLQAAMLFSPLFGPRTSLVSVLLLNVLSVRVICSSNAPDHALTVLPICAVILYLSPSRPSMLFCLSLFAIPYLVALLAGNREKSGTGTATLRAAVLLSVLVFTVLPLIGDFFGYRANYQAFRENEQRIDAYLSSTPEDQTLELYYLPNDSCRYTAPYDTDYHAYWYKRSRHLPKETVLTYIPFHQSKSRTE